MAIDEVFLQRAIALARAGVDRGDGGPFGAVIVKDGRIVGEGCNRVVHDRDATAHAEIVAIRAASKTLGHFHLTGCVLYASSEPCPMCLSAAYWAHLARVVFANTRQEAAALGFCDNDLYAQLRLPHGERTIPTVHHPLAGASEPLRRWQANPRHVHY